MIVIILIAIDIHELAHAVVADRLGDPTPRRLGEISLIQVCTPKDQDISRARLRSVQPKADIWNDHGCR